MLPVTERLHLIWPRRLSPLPKHEEGTCLAPDDDIIISCGGLLDFCECGIMSVQHRQQKCVRIGGYTFARFVYVDP